MPEVGQTKQYYYKESRQCVWVKCPSCQEERWMQVRNYKRGGCSGLCLSCYNKGLKAKKVRDTARKVRRNIRGIKKDHGYIFIKLYDDDFYFPMANQQHYVREHRLVMAKHLGRCLHPWEIVHHRNRIKDDNRIENLQLASADGHNATTILQKRITYLEKKLKEANIDF